VQLTRKGNAYRDQMIKVRRAADEKLRTSLTPSERASLLKLLSAVERVRL
jgi:DNA-binding MarR family transcriptional regulator